MKEIIVLIGPTGVGKSACSIKLAKLLDAEIINGDSVSIYKHLNIGSAKIKKSEMDEVKHHLIDIKEPDEYYSVCDYQQDIRKKIEEITKRNKRIIIVGGTGLYIKAGLYNYNFNKEDKVSTYDELTNEEIIEKIKKHIDITNIDINNRRRLIRLLNKIDNNCEITNNKDELLYNIKVIGLTLDRDILYNRINDRVDKMFTDGLVDEVNSLKEMYPKSRILNSAIGYREFIDYFNNEKTIDEVRDEIKLHSRRYAKRQYTFFRHQFNTIWINVDLNNLNNTIDEIMKLV